MESNRMCANADHPWIEWRKVKCFGATRPHSFSTHPFTLPSVSCTLPPPIRLDPGACNCIPYEHGRTSLHRPPPRRPGDRSLHATSLLDAARRGLRVWVAISSGLLPGQCDCGSGLRTNDQLPMYLLMKMMNLINWIPAQRSSANQSLRSRMISSPAEIFIPR